MPLSEHEQKILEEIERRLAEEDPRLVEQVGRTDLYTHLARRIRLATVAFWVAAAGFVLMVLSAMLIYRYLGQLGRDQIRAMQSQGRLTLPGFLGRMAMRFGRNHPPTNADDDV
jgi:hypothetical protein